jgi:hypothetical protein
VIHLEQSLRPRGRAEILDVALESLRRDLALIATASLLLNAPLAIAVLTLIYGVTSLGPSRFRLVLPLSALAAALTLARPLAHGAVARLLAARLEEGRTPSLREAYGAAFRGSLAALFSGLVFWILALGGGVIYVIPGLFFGGWCVLGPVVAALEKKGPFEALSRAGRLLKGHGSRGAGFLTFLLVVYGLLTVNAFAGVQGILFAARALLGLETAYYEAVLSPENGIFATAVVFAIYLAVEPWKSCALYHFYLDARIRNEALDLRGAADRICLPASTP